VPVRRGTFTPRGPVRPPRHRARGAPPLSAETPRDAPRVSACEAPSPTPSQLLRLPWSFAFRAPSLSVLLRSPWSFGLRGSSVVRGVPRRGPPDVVLPTGQSERVAPPSIAMTEPVTYPQAGESRNAAVRPNSAGSP